MTMTNREQITPVILAAGTSSRMGRSKQLVLFNGLSMLDHSIQAVLDMGIARPLVVLGHDAVTIIAQAKFLKFCETVINQKYLEGIATSLQCGVQSSPKSTMAYLFLHADQPLITKKLIEEMVEKFLRGKADILYPTYKAKRGNPVIISAQLRGRLLEARGDSGARFLFNDPALRITAYPVNSPAVLLDVDTEEDLQNLQQENQLARTDPSTSFRS